MSRRKGKKFKLAFDEVWRLITQEIEEGNLLPPEIEIAAKLSLNRLTVAKALNELEKDGYLLRRAGMGTRLVRKPPAEKTGFIMVLGVDESDTKQSEGCDGSASVLFNSIQQHALNLGLPVLWVPCQDIHGGPIDTDKLHALYNPAATQGIIITNSYISAQQNILSYIRQVHCPIVWALTSPPQAEAANRIDVDNRKAAEELINKLIKRGCHNIACFSHYPNTIAREERLAGYRDALKKNGIAFREELCLTIESASLVGSGRDCAALFLSRQLEADGAFCVDSGVFTGMVQFFREYKPEMLANLPAVTFDAIPNAAENLVATVRQPLEDIGKAAVTVLSNLIHKPAEQPVIDFLPYQIYECTEKGNQ